MSEQKRISPKTQLATYCIISLVVVSIMVYSYFYFTEIKPLEDELIELKIEEQRLYDAILDERQKQSELLDEMIKIMESKK